VFVLPAWLLYLPLILKLKDIENRRFWILLGSGILLGPAVLALWLGISVARGESPSAVWQGDPLGPSTVVLIVLSAVLTFAVAAVYAASPRLLHARRAAAPNRKT
jgi:hypothetical protein